MEKTPPKKFKQVYELFEKYKRQGISLENSEEGQEFWKLIATRQYTKAMDLKPELFKILSSGKMPKEYETKIITLAIKKHDVKDFYKCLKKFRDERGYEEEFSGVRVK